jgi:hypothetical protein
MASQTAICNRALTKLGSARILAITDDVKAARELNSMWDIVVDAELRRNIWNFSVARTSLAALAAAPAWGFTYQFQLPVDYLRLVQVGETYYVSNMTDYRSMPEWPFQVESSPDGTKVIVTDYTAPLKIRYCKRVTDTQQFDALFVEALASRLAYECCEAITQSTSKREAAWADYKQALREAKLVDAIENPPEPLADDAWLLSRL